MKTLLKNTITMAACGLTGLVLLTLLPSKASTQIRPAECFRFTSEDNPFADQATSTRSDVWCYRPIDGDGSMMIYAIDEKGHTAPELSIIAHADGTITHASLLAGRLTVHRLQPGYNPLPVPLTPPEGAERVREPITISSARSSDDSLKVLTTSEIQPEAINGLVEGEITALVAPDKMPWRGYWFPHSSGRLHTGSNSPLAKYDRYVKARTGKNPGAQSWERRNHEFTGVDWAGHCNGWAATSVLRKEPTSAWTDPLSGVTFSVGDQKGILIERDYCPKVAFFGKRFNGRRGDVSRDIDPVLFHNTITYYIGNLGKPVLMDYKSGIPVENRAVSGYKMNVKKLNENDYEVETILNVHTYDTHQSNDVGVAPYAEKIYRYRLSLDATGAIVDGKWLSSNPDFIWVPISPGSCEHNNPYVTENWVETIGQPLRLRFW